MTQLNVLNSLVRDGGRLGVYTNETSGSIPNYPGCYAWFLPLWFYSDDFDKLISTIGDSSASSPIPLKPPRSILRETD